MKKTNNTNSTTPKLSEKALKRLRNIPKKALSRTIVSGTCQKC